MDRLPILDLPDDKGIILPDAGQEFIIRTKLQFQNLILYAAQDSHWLFRLHVPENNGSISHSLECSTFLASSNDIARV